MSAAAVSEQCLDSMLNDTLTDVVYQNTSLFNDSLEEEYTVNKVTRLFLNTMWRVDSCTVSLLLLLFLFVSIAVCIIASFISLSLSLSLSVSIYLSIYLCLCLFSSSFISVPVGVCI